MQQWLHGHLHCYQHVFQTNVFFPSGHGEKFLLLDTDIPTPQSVVLPLKYLQSGVLPLCFHEINTKKKKSGPHKDPTFHMIPAEVHQVSSMS